MTQSIALVRDDDGSVLTLPGLERVRTGHPGQVTRYPVEDLTYTSDGAVILPRQVSADGVVSLRGQGAGHLDRVERWLSETHEGRRTVSVTRPSLGSVPLMLIEEWSTEEDHVEGFRLSLRLVGVQLASIQSLTVIRQGAPRDDVTVTTAENVETGQGATSEVSPSWMRAIGNSINAARGQ